MTASPKSEPTPGIAPEATTTPQTAGQLLRETRLQAGVHLAVLSVKLKVPVRQLEALEANDLDMAKGAVFYRGLASGVCRHLNADPAAVLALLPQASGQLAPLRNGLAGSASERAMKLGPHSSGMAVPGKVFVGAALMLLLTAALLWTPGPSQWGWFQNLKLMLAEEVVAPEQGEAMAPSQMGDPIALLPADQEANAAPSAAPSMTAEPMASESPFAAPASDAKAAAPSASNQAPAVGPEWVFTATQDSWLELRNGLDAIIWSGTLKAAESQRIQAALPVRVVVGRAPAVSVSFRGQPFDLKPHTRSTVARFEVKE